MKNKLLLLSIILFATSCSLPSYTVSYESVKYAPEYIGKKWILTPIKGASKVSEKQDKYITDNLKSCLEDNLIVHFNSTSEYLLPKNPDISPNLYLQALSATDLDYWIEIKNSTEKGNDAGNISAKSKYDYTEISVAVTVNIYDVKKNELIYSQKVKGRLSTEGNKEDVVLHKSATDIQYKALQKAVKNLKKDMLCR